MNDPTFECHDCGRTLPLYDEDGGLQPSLGLNLGFGMFYWCRDCKPPGGDIHEIIEQFDMFINPKKEMP